MRKYGGLFFVALLLLLAPALANAWTLTVDVNGPSTAGEVKIYAGNGITAPLLKSMKSGTAIVQVPVGSAAYVVVTPNGYNAATVKVDYVAQTSPVTILNDAANHKLFVGFATASDKIGSIEVDKNPGGSVVLESGYSSTMTKFTNLTYGTTVGIKANPNSDYKVTNITVTAASPGAGTNIYFNGNPGQAQTIGYTVDAATMTATATYVLVPNAKAVLSAPLRAVVGQPVRVSANGTTSNLSTISYDFVVTGNVEDLDQVGANLTFTPTGGDVTVTLTIPGTTPLASKTATIKVVSEASVYNNLCVGCHSGSTPDVISAYNAGSLDDTTPCAACHTSGAHTVGPYTHKIVNNSAGRDVAAGSDVCLTCHTDFASWEDTPHTQKAQMGKEYVHPGAATWITANRETYVCPDNTSGNTGGQIQPDGVRAVMTENPLRYSSQTFGVDDITVVIGSNHKQAYAVWMEGYGYKILNIRYNNLDPGLTPSMGNRKDERVWEGSCIGCHSTTSAATANLPADYADSATPFDLNPYLGDLRVGCEACHGPVTETGTGTGIHSGAAGEGTGHALNPAGLTQDQQIDICGRCHGNWNSTVAGTTARKDVPEFKAGDSLVYLLSPGYNGGVDRIRRPSWNAADTATKPFLGNGASNDDHQQWYDFKIGNHYGASVGGVPVTCTSCHDPHQKSDEAGRIYGRIILKGSYDLTNGTSTVCAGCHEGASFVDANGKTVTKKDTAGAINPHTGKAYGVGVDPLPAPGAPWPWE